MLDCPDNNVSPVNLFSYILNSISSLSSKLSTIGICISSLPTIPFALLTVNPFGNVSNTPKLNSSSSLLWTLIVKSKISSSFNFTSSAILVTCSTDIFLFSFNTFTLAVLETYVWFVVISNMKAKFSSFSMCSSTWTYSSNSVISPFFILSISNVSSLFSLS